MMVWRSLAVYLAAVGRCWCRRFGNHGRLGGAMSECAGLRRWRDAGRRRWGWKYPGARLRGRRRSDGPAPGERLRPRRSGGCLPPHREASKASRARSVPTAVGPPTALAKPSRARSCVEVAGDARRRGRGPDRPARCRAAPPRRRRGSWHRRRSAEPMPPTPISGSAVRGVGRASARTRVERSNSGAPERPPASARCRLARPSRASVVLVQTSASTRAASAVSTIAGDLVGVEVGGDLQEDRDRPRQGPRAPPSRRRSSADSAAGALQLAQAFGIGRGDVDGGEIDMRAAERRAPRAKSAARSGEALLAPRFSPTGMPRGRGGKPGGDGFDAVVVEAEAVDDRARPRAAGTAAAGGCRAAAAAWRRRVSTKPKPARISGATATAFLSKPAARPTGLASVSPAQRRGAGAASVTGPGSGAGRGGAPGGPGHARFRGRAGAGRQGRGVRPGSRHVRVGGEARGRRAPSGSGRRPEQVARSAAGR